jgi:hypothetical protein
MKKIVLIIFALFLALSVFGQNRNQNQRQSQSQRNNIPQTSSKPTEQEIAKRQREIDDRKDEYIANFLTTLEADEFQKHIIKQNLDSFYVASVELSKTDFGHVLDRQAAFKNLKDTYFVELEDIISESDMTKLKELISGKFNEKEVLSKKEKKKKKKKKKKKRKKKKKDQEEKDEEDSENN